MLGDGSDKLLNYFSKLGEFALEPAADWCQLYCCATKNKSSIVKQVPSTIASKNEKNPSSKDACIEKFRFKRCAEMSDFEFAKFLALCEEKSKNHMSKVFSEIGDKKRVIKTLWRRAHTIGSL